MDFKTFVILLSATGYCFSASTSNKDEIVEIRDALNEILKENDIKVQSRSAVGGAGCPFHACTAEILECNEAGLTVNENGCTLCECAEPNDVDTRAEEDDTSLENSFEDAVEEKCVVVKDEGDGDEALTRFFYDLETNECEKFIFRGRNGNDNNFQTLEDCNLACVNDEDAPDQTQAEEVKKDVKPDIPCPAHSCSAETLKCPGDLATDKNGCPICECAGTGLREPVEFPPLSIATRESEKCYEEEIIEEVEPTEESLSACERERKEAEKLEEQGIPDGKFKPVCDPDGSYASVQCNYNECWCVLDHGVEVQGTRLPSSEKESLSCSEKLPPTKATPPPKEIPVNEDIEEVRRQIQSTLDQLNEN